MISSLIYVLIFGLMYVLILLYPKSKAKLNIVKQVFLSFCIVICLIALPGYLLKVLGITLNLNHLSIVNALISLVLYVKIKKIGHTQRFFLNKIDLINVIVLTVIFALLFVHIFSLELRLCYLNSDIANHFSFARSFVDGNNDNVGIMYLTALINATFINLAKFALEPIYYYKAFIIGDAFVNWFGLMIFYVLLTHFVKRPEAKKYLGLCSLLYFGGFPVYSYLIGGFIYWSLGVTLICFLVYLLDVYSNNQQKRKEIEVFILLSFISIGMSYTLFIPFVYIASFCFLVYVLGKEGNIFNKESIFLFLKMYIIPALFIIVFVIMWFNTGQANLDSLKAGGGIYSNLYSDFWPFLPFILYNLFNDKGKRKSTQIFLAALGVCIVFMLVCCHAGFISGYYYYKMYYPLWALCWIEAAMAVDDLIHKREKFLIYYMITCAAIFLIGISPIEEKIVEKNEKMQTIDGEIAIFPIYQFMLPYIQNGFAPQDEEENLDLYQYVTEVLQSDNSEKKRIPCIASKDIQVKSYWYSAITGNGSLGYFNLIRENGFSDEVMSKLEQESDYFVMYKDSDVYIENYNMLQEYEIEYENAVGVIYKIQ